MSKGYLAFVLHAHLPFVYHPEYDSFLEERWFFEAMTETYLPLIKFFDKLKEENIPFKLTISLSPSLLAMMENPLLQDRYLRHLDKSIELCEKEIKRHEWNPHFKYLAQWYKQFFTEMREIYADRYHKRISQAFKQLHEQGSLELITTAATHGLLPALAAQPKAIEAQIAVGVNYFKEVFGFAPQGMWLPECGYYAGLDAVIKKYGIRYFFVESHGIDHAGVNPYVGVYGPIFTPSGVAAFGREQGVTKQVWSAREGFPGHPQYREFYRDIGFDTDFNYIQPYIEGNIRVDTGIKYHRITGPSSWKDAYVPDKARDVASHHAREFVFSRVSHINYLSGKIEAPIIIAPFDAELFGHWWFEGPQWLDYVIRKGVFDQNTFEFTTPSEYLNHHPIHVQSAPASSTWGAKGYFEGWINNKTDWIYPQLYECAARMERLANKFEKKSPSALVNRGLNQALRELLLAQSSDWPFIINNGTSAQYATRRVKDHVSRFHYLANAIEANDLDKDYVTAIENMDNIFPKANWEIFKNSDRH